MQRIEKFETTAAMRIDTLAKAKGIKYNLAAGDPNIDLQECIVEAYKNIDLQKCHQYCGAQGLFELRSKIDNKPENVVITNGAKQALYMTLKAVAKPNDNVLIIGPCWSSYISICELLDIKPILALNEHTAYYVPSIDWIKKLIKETEISAILINNPNNPTGHVYSKDYLLEIEKLAEENHCWIISDEIYSELLYTKKEFYSLKNRPNVIYISGFSKAYSLTGWRLGYIITNKQLAKVITNIQAQMSGPPSTLIQTIILNCFDSLKIDTNIYKERINILDIFWKYRPYGGFYFYIPIGNKWFNSEDCCNYFLDKGIALTPGDDYGISRTIRLSIANINVDSLKEIREELNLINIDDK